MKRAVFLDRDGVLNAAVLRDGRPYPPAGVDDVVRIDGVVTACTRLAAAGFLLVVVTNQPDIARGSRSRDEVDAVNAAVTSGLPITEVIVCPHDDADECACRKPKPGMLLAAADRWDIDLAESVTVGDRWRDVEAGRQAGTRTIYVDRGYSEPKPRDPDHVVPDLAAAAALLLGPDWGALA